nr:MAG TPA: hypothetical protein [Caudoviricetes sp.]
MFRKWNLPEQIHHETLQVYSFGAKKFSLCSLPFLKIGTLSVRNYIGYLVRKLLRHVKANRFCKSRADYCPPQSFIRLDTTYLLCFLKKGGLALKIVCTGTLAGRFIKGQCIADSYNNFINQRVVVQRGNSAHFCLSVCRLDISHITRKRLCRQSFGQNSVVNGLQLCKAGFFVVLVASKAIKLCILECVKHFFGTNRLVCRQVGAKGFSHKAIEKHNKFAVKVGITKSIILFAGSITVNFFKLCKLDTHSGFSQFIFIGFVVLFTAELMAGISRVCAIGAEHFSTFHSNQNLAFIGANGIVFGLVVVRNSFNQISRFVAVCRCHFGGIVEQFQQFACAERIGGFVLNSGAEFRHSDNFTHNNPLF